VKTLRLVFASLVVAVVAVALLPFGPGPREAEAQVSIYDPSIRTTELYIQRRAIGKIGSAIGGPQNVAWLWDDFTGNQNSTALPAFWNSSNTGSAADSLQGIGDEGGGVQQITTGATAASRADRLTNAPMVQNANTKPWYFAVRMKITTAVTAQTKLYAGLLDASVGAQAITAGFHGSLHATNLVVQYDGSEAGSIVNLGVAADTAFHVYEVWGRGDSKLHCSIDLSSTDICAGVTMATGITTSGSLRREAVNGTDAVARSVRFDYIALMAKRS
jgi:hypothetical protein